MHQYTNSVAVLLQLDVSKVHELTHLLQWLRKRKIGGWQEWNDLDWDARFKLLRQMSFSSLKYAAIFFDDIYGKDCFDQAWGDDEHIYLKEA